MIPKNIFFVWLGDKIPDYVNFCIENFRKVNPDFKVDLYHYTDEDVELSKKYQGKIFDSYGKYAIDNSLNRISWDKNYYNDINNFYKIALSVKIRMNILTKNGGIYLDCDTFPIKPFDSKLLELDNFYSSQEKQNQKMLDIFFMGRCPNTKKDPVLLKTNSGYRNLWKDEKFLEFNSKFYNLELKYGDSFNDKNEHYIDHYWIRKFKY